MEKKQLVYQETEKKRATALFKGKCGGKISGKVRDFALKNWTQNFWDDIRDDVISYFEEKGIKWHRYAKLGHLLSSQVCCINYLFPIIHDKKNVLRLAKAVCADFIDVLPVDTYKDLPVFIQFEAISSKSYLNEGHQTPGSNCTSIDALIYAEHKNGSKYLIPIEWKYTEYYDNKDKSIEDRRGDVRLKRYSKLITNSRYLKSLPNYRNSVYFFEPFYQLMRQTLWAEQMIQHKKDENIKADNYIHVHIIPNENEKLLKREKGYKVSKKPLLETWQDNLKDKEKYVIKTPMDFIKHIDHNKYSDLLNYLQKRYWNNLLIKS